MNYYQPREIADKDGKPTGKFHYTVRNDDRIYAVGYCATDCDGHETPDEARQHYRAWELDNDLRLDGSTGEAHYPCVVCGALTNKQAYLAMGMTSWTLCDDHRTRAEVEQRYSGPGNMISSW